MSDDGVRVVVGEKLKHEVVNSVTAIKEGEIGIGGPAPSTTGANMKARLHGIPRHASEKQAKTYCTPANRGDRTFVHADFLDILYTWILLHAHTYTQTNTNTNTHTHTCLIRNFVVAY